MRELEFSKLTLRLVDKENARDDSNEHTVAKLSGDTFTTLQRILVCICLCTPPKGTGVFLTIAVQPDGTGYPLGSG